MRGRHAALDDRYRQACEAQPTYRPGTCRGRWGEIRRQVLVGEGRAVFDRAAGAVRGWAMWGTAAGGAGGVGRTQRAAGVRVHPEGVRPDRGATVLLIWQRGGLRIVAPCRVVDAVDDGHRAGFTYVTLPGHPECGQESFTVQIDPDGTVRFTVEATSRPARWYSLLGAPVTRAVQRTITDTYLAAVQAVGPHP